MSERDDERLISERDESARARQAGGAHPRSLGALVEVDGARGREVARDSWLREREERARARHAGGVQLRRPAGVHPSGRAASAARSATRKEVFVDGVARAPALDALGAAAAWETAATAAEEASGLWAAAALARGGERRRYL